MALSAPAWSAYLPKVYLPEAGMADSPSRLPFSSVLKRNYELEIMNFRKWLWIMLMTIAGILGIAVIAVLWLSFSYKTIIHNNLPLLCHAATDSLYDISIADVRVYFMKRSAVLKEIRLQPDTAQVRKHQSSGKMPPCLFTLEVPELKVSGVNWFELLFRNAFRCKSIHTTDPNITMVAVHDSLQKHRTDTTHSERVYAARLITCTNPSLLFVSSELDSIDFRTGGRDLTLEGFCYDPGTLSDSTKVAFNLDNLRSEGLIIQKRKGHYSFKAETIDFSRKRKELHVMSLTLKPVISRDRFYKIIGHQKVMYDLEFPSIRIEDIDWPAFLDDRAIVADRVTMDDPRFMTFLNLILRPAPEDKLGEFPNQLLQRCRYPMHIKQVSVNNAFIKYTEISNVTKKAGEVTFTEVQGIIRNITNIPSAIDSNAVCTADAQGKFFGRSRIVASFTFPLIGNTGAFEIKANHEALNMTGLNHMARDMALVEFESLNLRQFHMYIKGNASRAEGDFTVTYNNLNITALKMDGDEIVKDNVKTFFLKNIMLYPHNPMPGKEVRTAHAVTPRDPYKSFFNLVWQSIMGGVLQTMLRNENYGNRLLEKQMEREAQRRREAWGPEI